ncbi:hypothetical protein KDH_74890 [Dictyobacter sp. S3.2.2.5]|uniref:Uncharacterized protein n=1 Tax=Dictyobacter halimunensis TaxID=3026934 RepID=A0ABQ6G3S9_9CHLR|nr:hypothetical protein KDH_74890 [Dictyobacter sp. S3.2.2.5]
MPGDVIGHERRCRAGTGAVIAVARGRATVEGRRYTGVPFLRGRFVEWGYFWVLDLWGALDYYCVHNEIFVVSSRFYW